MEQPVKKRQIAILAAGGLVTLALVAAHYLSPVSKRLAANEDVELVLLNKDRPMLFVYHPFSRTLNAVRLPARAARSGSAYQRACEVLKLFPGGALFRKGGEAVQTEPAYIEVSAAGGPDMDAFEDLVNTWRARPARLAGAVRYLRALKKSEATNLSAHELVLLALELSRLNSSNFIKEDFDKTRPGDLLPAAAGQPEPGPAVVRLEVLNASGKQDLARRVTKYLRNKGFDVLDFGTYGSVEKQTKIVNCSDSLEGALRLREALGLEGLEIYSKFDKTGIVQAKVILGADFDESKID